MLMYGHLIHYVQYYLLIRPLASFKNESPEEETAPQR
jgi:hypothetical protein